MKETNKKEEKLFIITSTTVFLLSYFLLKAIFEKIEWSNISEWIVIICVSGLFFGIFNLFLTSKKTYKTGVVFSIIYFSSLIAILYFQPPKDAQIVNISLQGKWITQEPNGENAMIDFFKKDSLALTYLPSDKRIFGYVQDKGKLKVFDEYEELIFDWRIKFENDKFSVEEDGHSLTFYKKEDL